MLALSRLFFKTILISVYLAQFCQAASPTVKLRINTAHGLGNAKGAVIDAGLRLFTEISVTSSSQYDGRPFLPPDKFIEDAQASGATIMSTSFSGWNYLYDSVLYQKLTDNGMVHVFAYVPKQPQPRDAPPPAAFVTVNRIGGVTGGGIEFGVPTSYMNGKGKSDNPSGVTAQLAGLMACLKYLHPSWNWFDVKAALRATAANYAGGYDPQNYGYGAIDYRAANSLAEADKLPLFGPAAVACVLPGNRIMFQINAFKQSRRFTEVLFRFASRPVSKMKELTLPEITAMGGEYVYSSYLRMAANTFTYPVTGDAMPYYVWLTQDSHGRFSRIESYSIIGPISSTVKIK